MTPRRAGLGVTVAVLALFLPGVLSAPARAAQPGGCPADLVPGPERRLAHRAVSGTAGPFARARVTLIGADALAGPFTGRLDVAGRRCFVLAGPEEPTGLFDFFVTRILFVPLTPGQANGIVVLYDQVHRAPEGHSFPEALAYRVDGDGAVRDPVLEQRLEGARSASQVRARLVPRRHGPGR